MVKRKELKVISIKQDNCTKMFNRSSNDMKGSIHNRRAKRLASKRIRQKLRKQDLLIEKE